MSQIPRSEPTKLVIVNDSASGDRITVSAYSRGARREDRLESSRAGCMSATPMVVTANGYTSVISIDRGQSQDIAIEGERPVLLITVAPAEPNLGLATTRQLLHELLARAETGGTANYRTVDGEG